MKKSFSFLIIWLSAIICSAQIQVFTNGSVGIGGNPYSYEKLFVTAIDSFEIGLSAQAINNQSKQIAVYGMALSTRTTSTGRAYGIYGLAGNRSSGYNYGVYGELRGLAHGAGVFGTNSTTIPLINGKYAGFFHGNTYVTGTLTASEVTTLSDARYKSNVQPINTTALSMIAALNPVQYTMLPGEAIALANSGTSDTTDIMTMTTSEEELQEANRIHYGLLAQEVKELYPELVHEDGAGVMSINYTELIPLLIQAVQDLSEQVNALSNGASMSATKQDVIE